MRASTRSSRQGGVLSAYKPVSCLGLGTLVNKSKTVLCTEAFAGYKVLRGAPVQGVAQTLHVGELGAKDDWAYEMMLYSVDFDVRLCSFVLYLFFLFLPRAIIYCFKWLVFCVFALHPPV